MLRDEYPVLKGAREIVGLASVFLEDTDSLINSIRAFESEADHLPLDDARELCSESFLQKSDMEYTNLRSAYIADILRECELLLGRYSDRRNPS